MNRRRYLAVLAGAGGAFAAGGPAAAALLDVEFDYTPQTVGRGDVLSVPVITNSDGDAAVVVGDQAETNYEVRVDLTDTDNRRVILRINVYRSGFDPLGDAYSVVDTAADSVTTDARTAPFGNPIETGQYELTLVDPATGDPVGLSSFDVVERTPGTEMSQWSTSVDTSLDTYDDIRDRLGDTVTTLEDRRDVPNGARMLYQLEIDGFAGVLTAYGDDVDAGTLRTLIDNGHVAFDVVQSNEPPNTPPKELDFDDSRGAISVWYGRDDDQLWIGLDTPDLVFTRSDGSGPLGVAPGDEFAVSFAVTDPYVGGADESASRRFGVDRRELGLADPSDVTLLAQSGQDIPGTTSSPGGTEYTVEIRGPNLLDRTTVTAAGDGTFAATFDLGSLAPGDELTATLKDGDTVEDSVTYTLSEPEGPPTASVTLSDQALPEGQFLVVPSVDLEEGGYVVVREDTAGGRILGVSRYLVPGEATDLTIALDDPLPGGTKTVVAVAHLDDGDETFESASVDPAYTDGDSPVADAATVTVPYSTTEPTTTTDPTTPEPTTTDPAMPEPTTTDPTTPEPTTTDPTTPVTTLDPSSPTTTPGPGTGGATTAGEDADDGESAADGDGLPMSLLLGGAGVGVGGLLVGGALYRYAGGSGDEATATEPNDDGDGEAADAGTTDTGSPAAPDESDPAGGTDEATAAGTPSESDDTDAPAGAESDTGAAASDPNAPPDPDRPDEPSSADDARPSPGASAAGAGAAGASGGENPAAQFVAETPAVASASLLSGGVFDTYVGAMHDGPTNVLFRVLSPAYDTPAARQAFEAAVGNWARVADTRYVASLGGYDTDPRPWVGILAGEETVADVTVPLDPSLRAPVVTGLTTAVQVAHDNAFNHCTLEPDHVHVVPEGSPVAVVSDWGLTAGVRNAVDDPPAPTPYTTPEQLSDGLSGTTDVYRCGAVLYRAFTGEPPVDPSGDLRQAIESGAYTPIETHVSTVPPGIDDVLRRALSTDPDERPVTPTALQNQLLDALD